MKCKAGQASRGASAKKNVVILTIVSYEIIIFISQVTSFLPQIFLAAYRLKGLPCLISKYLVTP